MSDLSHDDVVRAVERASKFLPAQGPITVFVHHNTLHAFEHLPFEEAVIQAGEVLGCQPFMQEDWYRNEFQRGRITLGDLEAVVAARTSAAEQITTLVSLRQLRLALLRYPLHLVEGAELRWHLNETGALWRLRQEVDPAQRATLVSQTLDWLHRSPHPMRDLVGPLPDDWDSLPLTSLLKKSPQKVVVRAIWTCCQKAVSSVELTRFGPAPSGQMRRHRDFLLSAGAGDADSLVNPFLIRFCAAFLDQGLADVAMPGRSSGLLGCFLDLYGSTGGISACWLDGLQPVLSDIRSRNLSAVASVAESLAALGVARGSVDEYVRDTLLVLKGWAGMIHQAQLRPDRFPVEPVPAELMDYLAVRLLLERFAMLWLLRHSGHARLTLADLRSELCPPTSPPPSRTCLAFQLYQVVQFLGLHPGQVETMATSEVINLLQAIVNFNQVERRRYLHLAYERHFRIATLDALQLHKPAPFHEQQAPFQAIFCIDEREESTRRHLEEVQPLCETFGTPGYFSIPMYYKAVHEPYPVALCPVSIRPRHLIREVPNPAWEEEAERRSALRRSLSHVANSVEVGSRSLAWGSLLTSGLGVVSALPALLRVLLPRLMGKFERKIRKTLLPSETHLEIERNPSEGTDDVGLLPGFTVEEMVEIVAHELENIGLRENFSPVILVIGHGSSSLNNPHEAAYDCGACGGGRGGPNARVLAWMANHPEVRRKLAERGLAIPAQTCFVGAYHNTCAEDIELYDLNALSSSQLGQLEIAVRALQEARGRDAQERCRRFVSASFNMTPRQALIHVEERASDLAQPRPECGHATNAVCVIGRRGRTRGLFMDRRAFLVSYDPHQDDAQGTILGRILRAVVPVGAGISLEYFFSSVDNVGYGCGTKLPHNITALLGVMDGYSSDLRTGLPRQMVEIHEPLRLLAVIETRPSVIKAVLEREESVRLLVTNAWVQVALLDPDSQEILVLDGSDWAAHQRQSSRLPVVAASTEWFHHQRESLEFAEIQSKVNVSP